MVAQEASYLRQLQMQMAGKGAVDQPIRVLLDCQPPTDIVHIPMYHARSKQILARYHFVIAVEMCQGAHMLTKHASMAEVRYNKKMLGTL